MVEIDLLVRADPQHTTMEIRLTGLDLPLPMPSRAQSKHHLTVVIHEATPDPLCNNLLSGAMDLSVGQLIPAPHLKKRYELITPRNDQS